MKRMTNDKWQMTNEAQMTNDEAARQIVSSFGFRHSFDIRHSCLVIFSSLASLRGARSEFPGENATVFGIRRHNFRLTASAGK
jgi:hypothetical protein